MWCGQYRGGTEWQEMALYYHTGSVAQQGFTESLRCCHGWWLSLSSHSYFGSKNKAVLSPGRQQLETTASGHSCS